VARGFTYLLAASMVSAALLLTTACTSSGGSPTSTSAIPSTTPNATESLNAYLNRVRQLSEPFVQCLAQHDIRIWDRSQGYRNLATLGTKGGWYKNGRVLNNDVFDNAFEELEGTYPMSPDFKPDQTIATWINNAASTGTWPKVCGPVPSAA
jgi:hypothetical protein